MPLTAELSSFPITFKSGSLTVVGMGDPTAVVFMTEDGKLGIVGVRLFGGGLIGFDRTLGRVGGGVKEGLA